MKTFFEKYVIRPKNERPEITKHHIAMMFAIAVFPFYAVCAFLIIEIKDWTEYFEMTEINDSCRLKYVVMEGDEKFWMCRSNVDLNKFYYIPDKTLTVEMMLDNVYINRKIYVNDDGTYNGKNIQFDLIDGI